MQNISIAFLAEMLETLPGSIRAAANRSGLRIDANDVILDFPEPTSQGGKLFYRNLARYPDTEGQRLLQDIKACLLYTSRCV